MTNSPVKYAETTLGVHTEYELLETLLDDLTRVRSTQIRMSNDLRTLRSRLEDREVIVAERVRTDFDLSSQAAYDRKLKEVLAVDEEAQGLRMDILSRANDVDAQLGEVRNLELRVKAKTARVEQIGHLLKYYAGFKEAVTEAKRQLRTPVENWPV